MGYRKDSVCGLYCGACDVFLANVEDRVAAAAKAWGMKPEQLVCHCCNSSLHAIYCEGCEIKDCASSRGIEHCADCDKTPCEKTIALRNDQHAHHSVILENQRQWRAFGGDAWLEKQSSRWQCPDCGTRFAWYDRQCRHCGAALFECTAEDEELQQDEAKDQADA